MTIQARKQSAVYKFLSPYTGSLDVEKQSAKRQARYYRRSPTDSDSDDDVYTPTLAANPSPSMRRARFGAARFYRSPNRVMRWLCLSLFVGLLLFVFSLFRFAISSSFRSLPIDVRPVPKPPQWESFPFLTRYHGGVRTLVPRKEDAAEYPSPGSDSSVLNPANKQEEEEEQQHEDDGKKLHDKRAPGPRMVSLTYEPYPAYRSDEYVKKYGEKRDCFVDNANTVRIPPLQYFPGVPRGFPDAVMGSNEMLGINDDVCMDRFGRLGPYGLGYKLSKGGIGAGLEGDRESSQRVWQNFPQVDYRRVNWGAAQNRCVVANNHRFRDITDSAPNPFFSLPIGYQSLTRLGPTDRKGQPKLGISRLPRTAFVIRTWHDFQYTEEDILYLRSLISELSIQSGGEYVVHFLIHVKDENLQIWSDPETYQDVLRKALPEEFQGMGTLWSEKVMTLMYPGLEETFMRGLPIHGVYRSTYMCMQYFAYQHPEYDYFWNWEMDARFTGHWYNLFDSIVNWAREQPRKGLWERNARFYVPSVHGKWDDFRQMVRVQTQSGTNSPNNIWSPVKPVAGGDGDKSTGGPAAAAGGLKQQGEKFIWGPERPDERDMFEVDGEGIPPTTMEKDDYQWGVGEDADLIVFNPLYDPEGTTWILRDDVTGYNREHGMPPRRTAIITASRLSRKLLHTMHRETSLKRHSMFSEMWPATTALHHGFKAVYVPHSMYVDRRWPTRYLESVFNGGRNGAAGGARTAVWGDREHNFRGTTWFYSAGFASNLWKRWLGQRVDNDGGNDQELAGEGRMCLPPILLHPVKDLHLDIEDSAAKTDVDDVKD